MWFWTAVFFNILVIGQVGQKVLKPHLTDYFELTTVSPANGLFVFWALGAV
jgi:hypothetical protein